MLHPKVETDPQLEARVKRAVIYLLKYLPIGTILVPLRASCI